jgi:hypothetical protein
MQRVRIGLTGLAFVFVLVLLAAIFVRPSADGPVSANSVAGPTGSLPVQALPENETAPADPLAELGVAPGNADANETAPATPAPATKP